MGGMMEGTLAIIGVFFIPAVAIVLIVWFSLNEKNKRNQMQADLYAKALEKGQSIPPDLFAYPKRKRNPLNTGIICIAVGIGVALFFLLAVDDEERLRDAALGIIPFLIGVAYLIIHFIERKQKTNENAQ